MEEWKEFKLSDLTIMKNGKKRPSCIGQYPVYGGNGIMDYADVFNAENTIVVGRVGAYCGNVYYCSKKCWVSDNAIAVFANDLVDIKYLFYLMSSLDLHHQHIGGAQPLMTQDIIGGFKVFIPSLNIQEKIASFLSSLDDKIELNRRINENLEQQAQALFKSWFVDFEPFKDGKFVNSELGMIPEGWRVGTIGDYCKIRSGFAFKSSWWTEKGVKIVKIKNISSSGILNMDDCSYVSKENVSKAKEFSLKPGDILIAMTGATIGKFCLVPALKEEMYVNQRVGKFFWGENPIMKIPFIHGLLKCENIISQIINKGQGSAQPNISGNDIETIPIIYPPEDIISKYNELVSPYFSMIIEHISACDFISQLRDTLLPRLMSGELAITDVDDRSIFQ